MKFEQLTLLKSFCQFIQQITAFLLNKKCWFSAQYSARTGHNVLWLQNGFKAVSLFLSRAFTIKRFARVSRMTDDNTFNICPARTEQQHAIDLLSLLFVRSVGAKSMFFKIKFNSSSM